MNKKRVCSFYMRKKAIKILENIEKITKKSKSAIIEESLELLYKKYQNKDHIKIEEDYLKNILSKKLFQVYISIICPNICKPLYINVDVDRILKLQNERIELYLKTFKKVDSLLTKSPEERIKYISKLEIKYKKSIIDIIKEYSKMEPKEIYDILKEKIDLDNELIKRILINCSKWGLEKCPGALSEEINQFVCKIEDNERRKLVKEIVKEMDHLEEDILKEIPRLWFEITKIKYETMIKEKLVKKSISELIKTYIKLDRKDRFIFEEILYNILNSNTESRIKEVAEFTLQAIEICELVADNKLQILRKYIEEYPEILNIIKKLKEIVEDEEIKETLKLLIEKHEKQ